MNKIICNVPLANVMKQPDHRSELHTQFLFGDRAEVMEVSDSMWIKVLSEHGQTSGWVLHSQFDEASGYEEPYRHIFFGEHASVPRGQHVVKIVNASSISRNHMQYFNENDIIDLNAIKPEKQLIHNILHSWSNAPYMWGGTSVYGIDCSGLSKMFYKFFSIHLPHLASAQMNFGEVLDFLSNARCGDLAFFENHLQEINHVGILLNDHEIIHASETNGKVMTDHIDQEGIINKVTGKRTHRLRLIKRLF